MKNLRVIVVDDESLARKRMARLLADQPRVDLVGSAEDMASAIALVESKTPDLVLLDISMPPESGFDLLPHLPLETGVVFVSAYSEHAIRAFDEGAIDYLLKPVAPERLAKALERVRKNRLDTTGRRCVILGDQNKSLKVALDRLAAIIAEGNYTRALTMDGGSFFVRRPFKEWQETLKDPSFVKLDRSLLVNQAAILGFETVHRDLGHLQLTGCKESISLGRTAIQKARNLLSIGRSTQIC
jgi:two-component system LytT family response regulator